MIKRLISLLLALALAFSLAACGAKREPEPEAESTPPVVEKHYAAEQAMDVFETVDAVRALKNFTFSLQANTINAETGEAGEGIYTLNGQCFADTKQLAVTVDMPNGGVYTHLFVDGDKLYVNPGEAAAWLSEAFTHRDEIDADYFTEELEKVSKGFSAEYMTFQLTEDPWATREGKRYGKVKALTDPIYESIRKDTEGKVKEEGGTCSLTLGLGDLQKQLLKVDGSLVNDSKTYRSFLKHYIKDNFQTLLTASGWTMDELLDTIWTGYEERYDSMTVLEESGDWNDWTMKAVTCGDEEQGYTIDWFDRTDKMVNYCLTVIPAEPEEIAMPEDTADYTAEAEEVFTVVMDTIVYRNYAYGANEDMDDYTDMYDDEFDEGEGDVGSEIETAPIEGYQKIVSTDMITDDGIAVSVPVPAAYDVAEVQYAGEDINDVFVYTDGYALQYTSIMPDDRKLKEIAAENAATFAEIFTEDWEYEITQPATAGILSEDKQVAVAGMGYHDSDENMDVTVITGNIRVKGSEYVLGFDLFVYAGSTSSKEIAAIEELLAYLGVESPVEIVKDGFW